MGLILVDTSVWVDHISRPVAQLLVLIGADSAVLHPFVLTELALGNLANWQKQIDGLRRLPSIEPVSTDAAIAIVRDFSLPGSGLGFVDAHLLAWTVSGQDRRLWTRDRRLQDRAKAAGVAWSPAA